MRENRLSGLRWRVLETDSQEHRASARPYLCESPAVRYAFIFEERQNHKIQLLCEVLEVSRSGYYKWLNRGDSEQGRRRVSLLNRIIEIHEESRGAYGCPRVYAQLRREGDTCNYKTVEKLMKDHEIRARRKRRYKSTTDSKHKLPIAPNVLDREFQVEVPDEVWVSDITYIETKQGWLYLAVTIDLFSRMVVGWSMSANMTAELVLEAFQMGIERQGRAPIVAHSDRGSQYASKDFRDLLKKHDCIQSMSRKGNCWDNAPAESFFGSLKSELIYHEIFDTRNQAQLSIFEYLEIFYNRQRLHSTLGYLTPEEQVQKGRKVA
jgi:transposase InsO family protein